ncbi:hypothetical protein EV363DRAFT_1309106 [Boletus edulis]|nr:hypothetical protein EV363DRAFT_1309106 [Boletus edulis]
MTTLQFCGTSHLTMFLCLLSGLSSFLFPCYNPLRLDTVLSASVTVISVGPAGGTHSFFSADPRTGVRAT